MPSLNQLNTACLDAQINFNLTTFNTQHVNKSPKEYLVLLEKELKKRLLLALHPSFKKTDTLWATTHSIADLFKQLLGEKNIENQWLFIKKIADAHAFIQATGFSTQNEASLLSMLDMINYHRAHESIFEIKTIMSSLFNPFSPLFREYQALIHEQNTLLKVIRATMPMVIIAATIIAVSMLLSSVLIHDIAFIFILMPTLYVGLFIATQYINAANTIYHTTRQAYYGGRYEVPEFQIQPNDRIDMGYKADKIKTNAIRLFYIQEINNCDQIERFFEKKHLTTLELKQKADNLKKRHMLQLEWYDMKCNKDVGIDKIPAIALQRIQTDGIKITEDYYQEQVNAWISAVDRSLQHQPVNYTFFKSPKIDQLIALETKLLNQ